MEIAALLRCMLIDGGAAHPEFGSLPGIQGRDLADRVCIRTRLTGDEHTLALQGRSPSLRGFRVTCAERLSAGGISPYPPNY